MIFTPDIIKLAEDTMAKPIASITRDEIRFLEFLSRNPHFKLRHEATAYLFNGLETVVGSFLSKRTLG